MIKRAAIYTFKFNACVEPDGEKKHDIEYRDTFENLVAYFVVKQGPNEFSAATIAFNQSFKDLNFTDKEKNIDYKVTSVSDVSAEKYKVGDNIILNLGSALEAQLPDTIEDLMTCWRSVNPEKNRNATPKER